MAENVIMPKAGMAMEEGTIVRWLKAVGESVRKGEAIAVIETDKVTMDLESDFDGTLISIVHNDGEVVRATETIGWIGNPGEKPGTAITSAAAPRPEAPKPAREAPAPSRQRVLATPAARARAASAGIALSTVAGTGPGGAVRRRDLSAGLARPRAVTDGAGPAAAMVTRADVTELLALRLRAAAAGRDEISFSDFVVRAVAAALREYPLLNSLREGDSLRPQREVNIGITVAREGGVAMPVIRGADLLTLRQIAAAARDLAERGRAGGLTAQDCAGATFTVTDLSEYGVFEFTPSIDGPQGAALGMGAIEERLCRGSGGVETRRVMSLCLARGQGHISDAAAASFIARIRSLLENVYLLVT